MGKAVAIASNNKSSFRKELDAFCRFSSWNNKKPTPTKKTTVNSYLVKTETSALKKINSATGFAVYNFVAMTFPTY